MVSSMEVRRKTMIRARIGVPLHLETHKKIDSKIVREGNVKRTRINKRVKRT
jgi:hypothetical protein